MLSIFVLVKKTQHIESVPENKPEVAKRLHTGEALLFDRKTLVLCHLIHPILMFDILVNMSFHLL